MSKTKNQRKKKVESGGRVGRLRFVMAADYAVADERSVPGPLGDGTTFTIRRIGDPAYQQWLKRAKKDSPQWRLINASAIEQFTAGGELDMEEAMRRAIAKIPPEELDLSSVSSFSEGVAKYLLVNVDPVIILEGGEEVEIEFSEEIALELLTCPDPVPQEAIDEVLGKGALLPGARRTVGDLLTQWVLMRAGETESFRQSFIAETEADFDNTSAGG